MFLRSKQFIGHASKVAFAAILTTASSTAMAQSVDTGFIMVRSALAQLEADFANEDRLPRQREREIIKIARQKLGELESAFDAATAEQREDAVYARSLLGNVTYIQNAIRARTPEEIEEASQAMLQDLELKAQPEPGLGSDQGPRTRALAIVNVLDREGNKVADYYVGVVPGHKSGPNSRPDVFWSDRTIDASCPDCAPQAYQFVAVKGETTLRTELITVGHAGQPAAQITITEPE